MSGMTAQEAFNLRSHTNAIRLFYVELNEKLIREYDGNNPDLTLSLQVAGLKEAIEFLDLVYQHHLKEFV